MALEIQYRRWIWVFHLLFWLLFSAISIFINYSFFRSVNRAVWMLLVNLSGHLLLVYIHLWVLLPWLFDRKKYVYYAGSLIALLILTTVWRFVFGWKLVGLLKWEIDFSFAPNLFVGLLFGGAFVLLISLPLRLTKNWFKKMELEKKLKTQQLEAELRFLKAQVNPHFLFNALNNIYALSFTHSDKAPEMILKLSDMMSYMLYDCKEESVRLSAEIAYLKNYIALHQLKKDGEQNIDFQVSGDVASIKITPMLFIPFFENAFKHGNLDDIKNGWLKSSMVVEDGNLKFQMENSVAPERKKYQRGGVGLDNIRERLRLLYPGRHQFSIDEDQETFSVKLQIQF